MNSYLISAAVILTTAAVNNALPPAALKQETPGSDALTPYDAPSPFARISPFGEEFSKDWWTSASAAPPTAVYLARRSPVDQEDDKKDVATDDAKEKDSGKGGGVVNFFKNIGKAFGENGNGKK